MMFAATLAAFVLQSKLGDADFPMPTPGQRHEQKVKDVRNHNYDLLMIGDSITQTVGEMGGEWGPLKKTWDTHFGPRNAINLGYSGYRTENVLWNLQNGELDLSRSPKVAVLLIGTNNTDDTNYKTVHTPEQIFAGTKAIVETIRQKHPTTKILVLRIFPRGGASAITDFHRRYNNSAQCVKSCEDAGLMTKKLADNKHVFWLDVNHVFYRKDGTLNTDRMPDLVHPNAAGTEAWATALEPTIAKLMDDKPIKGPHQIELEKAPKAIKELEGKRVMILGDSITQDGRYVGFMEYFLQKQYPNLDFNFFPIGLASETASGLTEKGHPFPRPDIHERLERALKAVRPEVVMACYGMNDGIYQPFDDVRFEAFKKGIASMVEQCKKAGAKVILITPPVFDATKFSALTKDGEPADYSKPYAKYDDVLTRYSEWEKKGRPGGAEVIDLHKPMLGVLQSGLELHQKGDGIHPTRLGHLVMAQILLEGLKVSLPKSDLKTIDSDELFKLVDSARATRSEGWLPYIGYTRGESFKTNDIIPTETKVGGLQTQVDTLRRK